MAAMKLIFPGEWVSSVIMPKVLVHKHSENRQGLKQDEVIAFWDRNCSVYESSCLVWWEM